MVIYAQVDGGFSVWDTARNYWKRDDTERPASYLFCAQEFWEGTPYCEGLIRDWASWHREDGDAFAQLIEVLKTLSPALLELLERGEPRKVSLDDPKRYPTLREQARAKQGVWERSSQNRTGFNRRLLR